MRNTFKFITVVMAVLLIFTSIPAVSFSAFAAELQNFSYSEQSLPYDVILEKNEDITKSQWLHNLVVVFGIDQEEYLLPDNYYADLSEEHEFYKDVLMAVDCGLVNLEEGEMFYPDAVLNRDFAVSTLNAALGYQLGEDDSLTFSDVSDCSDANSAQIALERGWVNLIDGKFVPTKKVTYDEAAFMLGDALGIVENDYVNPDYESSYDFLSDVKVVPSAVFATKDADGTVHITDCPIDIYENDKFAVYFNGIPNVYTAKTVELVDNETVITCLATDFEDAFTSVDAEGVLGFDSFEFVPEEGVDIKFVDDTSAGSSFSTAKLKNINAPVTLTMGGVDVTIDVTIKKPQIEYYVKSDKVKVALSGDYEIEYSAEVNMLEAGGLEKSIPLFACNVLGVGTFKISVNVDFTAKAGGFIKGRFVTGLECEKDKSIRAIKQFTKKDCYDEFEGSTKISLKASLSTTDMPCVSASVYAAVGYKSSVNKKVYNDGKAPHICEHRKAYIFADYGLTASVQIGIWKQEEKITTDVYNEFNSPVRTVAHFEDDRLVGECTRNGYSFKYFSKYNSRWFGGRNGYGMAADGSMVSLFDYEVNDSEQIVITGYNGSSNYINIPEEIDGKKVVAIENSAFRYLDVVSVSIPNTVTEIRGFAFANCPNLRTVKFSNALSCIDACAFYECFALNNVVLPSSLKEIGAGSFGNCTSIRKINIPKGLSTFVGGAFGGPFSGCVNLKDIDFEENITEIIPYLFEGCGLEEIEIPDTVTKIGYNSFSNCELLENITFSENLDTIENRAFENCISLTKVVFPEFFTQTQGAVFLNCTSLSEAFIPQSLANANRGYIDTEGGMFAGCSSLNNIVLDDGIKIIPDFIYNSCTGITDVILPETVKEIEDSSFEECTNLKTVKLPTGITDIYGSLFSKCASLCEIEIPEGVKSIWYYAFTDCSSLEKVKLPQSLEKIYGEAFYHCSSLKEIEIPNSVTYIGHSAFKECTSLEKVKMPVGLENIDGYLFNNCISLKEFTVPKAVKNIGSYAFENCSSLETLNFEEGSLLDTIDNSAFRKCIALKSLTLPTGLRTIHEESFFNCSSLTEVFIPYTVKTIESYAFENCSSLIDVIIEDYSITELKVRTFAGCSALKTIKLPKGLVCIEEEAFLNNTALFDVIIPESVMQIEATSFSYPLKTTIYSMSDTYVHEFANEYNFKFEDNSVLCEGMCLKDGEEFVEVVCGETFVPEFEFYPEDCNEVISLTTDNGIVVIDGHEIKTYEPGLAIITATSTSGAFCEFTLYVKGVERIEITSMPNKTVYNLGEKINLDGIVVEAFYDDGTSFVIEDYEVSGFDSTYEGVCPVYVSYVAPNGWGFDTYFDVEIVDPRAKVTDIYIASLPNKLIYERRESLDLTGLVVMANYSDGSSAEIKDYKVSGYNALKNGVHTLTVAYEECTVEFNVMVGITVVSVDVVEMPYITEYFKGEEFSSEGLIIEAEYSNGTTVELTEGFTVSGFDCDKTGKQIITVEYFGAITTFEVTVIGDEEEYIKGDVNGDGTVNASDLAIIKKLLAGLISEDDESVKFSDIDANGITNASDLAILKKMLAGIM